MRRLKEISSFLKDGLWRKEALENGRLKRYGIKFLRFANIVSERFSAGRCSLQAAGLTYFTMMSLIPVMCLLLLLARTLGAGDLAREQINAQIGAMIENVEKGQEENLLTRSPEVTEAREKQAKEFAGKARAVTDEMFQKIDSFNAGTLGYFGLGLVLWTLVSTLSTIETAFNAIWRVKRQRPLWKRFYLYAFISLVLPILIALAMSLPVLRFVKKMLTAIIGSTSVSEIVGESITSFLNSTAISTTISLFFATLAFALFFSFMPNRKISFRSSFFSGIITSVLFFFWMKLCAIAQVGIANANALYGSFAFFPIVLAWAYMSWQIVLIGGSMTYAFECVHRRVRNLPYA